MKIISIATMKGGAGKTSFTFNMSGMLAADKKVLLVDADPQANLTDATGVDITNIETPSIKNIFDGVSIEPQDLVIKEPIESIPNLDIIPSSIFLYDSQDKLYMQPNRERFFFNYICDYIDYFSQYDYIICDTNPSMDLINQNIFFATDNIVLIADCSYHSYLGLQLFQYMWSQKRTVMRKEDNISAVVINMYDKRAQVSKDMYDYIGDPEGPFSGYRLNTYLPTDTKIKASVMYHQPINKLMGESNKSSKAIRSIISELQQRGVL